MKDGDACGIYDLQFTISNIPLSVGANTITVNGKIAYYNIAWYRPRPLVARSNEWISPQVIALQNLDQPDLQGGVKMGFEVIRALEFDTGFTHMEWYRKVDGEVVFGEIGARPPGAARSWRPPGATRSLML